MRTLCLKCHIVSSKCFFRLKSGAQSLQAQDVDGWFFIVGKKVI